MARRKISNYRDFDGVQQIENNGVVDPEYVPTEDKMMEILRDVFAVDERTGLPMGDIAYYLSPDGNPQVREWLQNNLLKPRSVSVGSSVEGVTDDMIVECARGKGESVVDYASRLRSIYDECVTLLSNEKKE